MTSNCLNMVLEHADGGDLLSAMEQEPEEKFSEYQSCCYFRQLVAALSFIHAQGLVHRDVSLENLLLCGNQVKLCDFGLAAYHKPMPPAGPGLTELVGKIIYMAPEVYKKRPCYDGRRADAWSAGVCLFIMLTGAPPLSKPNRTDPCSPARPQGRREARSPHRGRAAARCCVTAGLGNALGGTRPPQKPEQLVLYGREPRGGEKRKQLFVAALLASFVCCSQMTNRSLRLSTQFI